MSIPEVKMNSRGFELDEKVKFYIREKIEKYGNFLDIATSIEVECTQNPSNRGVKNDNRIEVTVHFPKTTIRVEKEGPDLKALVDEVSDIVGRKAQRYKAKLREWQGDDSWKIEEVENGGADLDVGDPLVVDYVPKIVKRKKIEDCTPVSEAEAIEKMEMMGYDALLFKNKSNNKFCMVYRRKKGGYGVVEPCE